MKVRCCCTETSIDKDFDSFSKIYREEIDENKIKSFFKQYFAISSKHIKEYKDYQIESPPAPCTEALLYTSSYSNIPIEDSIYPISSSESEQDKVNVQKAICAFRKLFYSPNLRLSSISRPTTVAEWLIKAKLILAVEGPVDSLNVTQNMTYIAMKKNDDTQDESLRLLSQNSFICAASLSLNENHQREKISWYSMLTSCYLPDNSKDQLLAISLTALLAAIIILLEEAMDQNTLTDMAVSQIFYKTFSFSLENDES
jgi:hypothetical protein